MTVAPILLAGLLLAGEDPPAADQSGASAAVDTSTPTPAPASLSTPPPAHELGLLRAELDGTATGQLRRLVSSEPRFHSLASEDRLALLASQRAAWNPWASLGNVFPGFGVGSLLQGDLRGLWLTATDAAAYAFLLSGIDENISAMGTDDPFAGTKKEALGTLLWLGGRVAGAVLPASWPGRRYHEIEGGFRAAPSQAVPLPTATLVPVLMDEGGVTMAGAAIAIRY